jgi:hypothetical protein
VSGIEQPFSKDKGAAQRRPFAAIEGSAN